MALNKSMHARNRYKDRPPDFAYLAGKYPEFQQHVQTTLTGRVRYGPRGGRGRPGRAVLCCVLRAGGGWLRFKR